MVFQSYAFGGNTNPINLHHGGVFEAAAPMPMSRKRKVCEEDEADFGLSSLHSNKLCLPRGAGLDMDQQAEFHPLPLDVSNAILASLSHDPFAMATMQSSPGSAYGNEAQLPTPSSSYAPLHSDHGHKRSDGSDYFGQGSQYPELDIYPSQPGLYGLMGPQAGASSNGMDVDGEGQAQGHGPHCKSIARLSVRHNGGTTSELWASCPDCGACTKVQSDQPSKLCYSP
ncbi:uncharacterized protein PFL1_01568 [Pseudozyma flocculosa PF-1]|uniref:Uncharacterized protein n=1 Tax=Pseudozyma flocculosa TaxID=84751 RepID=A0A5C3EYT9_9BASI|nr:uncharacterized protein PFL1_01568 [Pseudozyma flocculosa PF-1]EPQ30667.1 hypothetical protein PFL1_01568 [Pseudozyma flocculosa PF-1]SPO37000.1 uncharacterized protein PSFLO_02472 [Pseudozyma flocculosa]